VYKFSEAPLDPNCTCPVCAKYSRAYLHHLTKTQEPLGWQLMGQHNIHFYHQLMREIRQSILEDRFLPLYHEKRQILQVDDVDHPITTPRPPPAPAARVGDYELRISATGQAHLQHLQTGHCLPATTQGVTPPAWIEALELPKRLRLPAEAHATEAEPLIIWDIGLGTGAAALAAIVIYEMEAGLGPVRPLHVVSVTDDLSPLRLALAHKKYFPHLRHGAADTLVHRQTWTSRYRQGLSWSLQLGPLEEGLSLAPGPAEILLDQTGRFTDGDVGTARLISLPLA
jgi:queuine tRNA-ribosyltransferase